MFKPLLVRDIVQAVRSRVSIPVTVKCRIGVDGSSLYSFTYLTNFKIEIAMKNWLISFQLLLEFLTRSMSTPPLFLLHPHTLLISKYSTSLFMLESAGRME